MTKTIHRIYVGSFIFIIIFAAVLLAAEGFDYYSTSIEERVFHVNHSDLKPSGPWGHGFGIIGTLMMITGVAVYMVRKRYRRFFSLGYLSYWLEFHIFLCTLGPILVLYHTAFKFGGIVAVSFWSMAAVVFSGVIGRFIYVQIPRTIQGKEIDVKELDTLHKELTSRISCSIASNYVLLNKFEKLPSPEKYRNLSLQKSVEILFKDYINTRKQLADLKKDLKNSGMSRTEIIGLLSTAKNRIILSRKIGLLRTMQKSFRYWHIIHLPFAITMFVILAIHVFITLLFGYKWIF